MPVAKRSDPSRLAVELLEALLTQYPQSPSVALFRCWEMALLSESEIAFESPVLDLGCGDGRIGARLLASGNGETPLRLIGVDIDRGSVRLAAQRAAHAGVVVADARAMPFCSGVFASAISICVLEHIPRVERVLAEVHRLLRPGGLLAFSIPTPRLLEMAAETHPKDPGYPRALCARLKHVNSWEPSRWRSLLGEAGLGVVDTVGFMGRQAARVWFGVNDWVERPIRGRGIAYRMAGSSLRRFGLGKVLASYWFRRLRQAAADGVEAPLDEASAALIVATKPDPA